jgi:hypothetical protein
MRSDFLAHQKKPQIESNQLGSVHDFQQVLVNFKLEKIMLLM